MNVYMGYTKKLLRNSLSLYRVEILFCTVTNAIQGEIQARKSRL